MAGITVSTQHQFDLTEATRRAHELAERFRDKLPIKEVNWSDDGTKGEAIGRGFSARFNVTETAVSVEVEFGIFLMPLAGQLKQQIQKSLDRKFSTRERPV